MSHSDKVVFSEQPVWSKVFSIGLLLYIAVHFYLVGNPIVFLFSIESFLIYKYGPSERFDYFWADSQGINLFSLNKEIMHINWSMVNDMNFGEDLNEHEDINIALSFKLDFSPQKIRVSGFQKSTIRIPSNRKKYMKLKKLRENYFNQSQSAH